MTATSTDVVLKILKQMSFSLTNGNKVIIKQTHQFSKENF